MIRSLITGGCGFVGGAFVRHCKSLRHKVVVVDDLSARRFPPRRPAFELHSGSLQNFCTRRDYEPDAFDLIIHCAAVVGGRLTIEGDPLAVAEDLAIDATFFNWLARAKKPPLTIYFSSSAVYPVELQRRASHCALSEAHQAMATPGLQIDRVSLPDLTYGWAKLSGEYLARVAVERYGANIRIYRPFSGYGAGQSLDYPLPAIVRRVLKGWSPIKVWGSGEQVRDWIHIDDIVAIVAATMEQTPSGHIMNLGSGVGTSFVTLAQTITTVLGHPHMPVKADPSQPEGVFYRVADTYEMRKHYNRPLIPLVEGISRLAVYFEKGLALQEDLV
jgi:GDP-L-fucose synthase